MKDSNRFKDKDQSLFEFYETLQKEYVTCMLRQKIYPRNKDKRYYEKTASFKESKIIDISERNHLPSLFNSDAVRKDINEKVYNEFGIPTFSYRNEEERLELGPKDIFYYYREGVEVKVKTDEGMKVGIISKGVDAEWKHLDGSGFKQLVVNSCDVVCVRFRGESEDKIILTSHVSRIM